MNNVSFLNDDLSAIASELPKSYATRWNETRKAAVVNAVQAGVITLGNAMERYRMSRSEFRSWQEQFAPDGGTHLNDNALATHH